MTKLSNFDRIYQDFDLATMSIKDLEALQASVDSELDARQFEENLRREVDSHLRRQAWVDSHQPQRSRRRRV